MEYESEGETRRLAAGLVVLAAGAVNSAILLLASADERHPSGLANRSDQVGRNFMNHNSSAMLAIDPRLTNDSVYQKTIGLNDFYLDDGRGGPALGNVQLLGRVSGAILKGSLRRVPEFLLNLLSRHAVDWYLMSEDLPRPESRVRLEGQQIRLDWQRSNMAPHARLAGRMREIFRAAGFPIVLTQGVRQAHALPSMRHGALRERSGGGTARSLLPRLRPSQSLRRRCGLPAELGGGQSGAHHRRAGAAHRRAYPPDGSPRMSRPVAFVTGRQARHRSRHRRSLRRRRL